MAEWAKSEAVQAAAGGSGESRGRRLSGRESPLPAAAAAATRAGAGGVAWGNARDHSLKRRKLRSETDLLLPAAAASVEGPSSLDGGSKKGLWGRTRALWRSESHLPQPPRAVRRQIQHEPEPAPSPPPPWSELPSHALEPPRQQESGLAQQTSTACNRSLPELNCIHELDDDEADGPAPRRPARFLKKSESTKVKSTSGAGEEVKRRPRSSYTSSSTAAASSFLSEALRSQSLTHLGCLENESVGDAMEARANVSGHHPLAVSMGDLSRVDQQRARLAKPSPKISSSQEYFSVTFDFHDEHVEEYLPAVQGRTLREALRDILDDRGIDLNSVQIVQEPTHTPFLPYCDTARLAGCHLRLKIKESNGTSSSIHNSKGSKANGIREKTDFRNKSLTGPKPKKGPFFGGSSTEEISEPLCPPFPNSQQHSLKNTKARSTERFGGALGLFTNPFKSDNDKLDALTEALDRYNQYGLPHLPGLVTFEPAEDTSIYQLEANWTEVVFRSEEMTEKVQQQQHAIWELLQTEANYIHHLTVFTDRFKLCLCNLQNEGILNEIAVDNVFSNIHAVQIVNRTFWQEFLLPMITKARIVHEPLNPLLMKEGFLKFEQLFSAYTKYCMDCANCIQYIKDKKRSNELFKAYIAWCETQRECNRQSFTGFIVKPMQRLTKYALVLKVILKSTGDEHTRQTLTQMINAVESFVCNVDARLRQRHEHERLAAISSRIESYDAVDMKDEEVQKILRQHLELDLTCPMPGCNGDLNRQLLMEGDLKLRDATKNGMDVRCFLFTDMLLLCKPLNKKADKVKVVRQPYLIDRLVVQELKERSSMLIIYLNEYHVATAVCILSGNDVKQWTELIRKAKDLYMDAKASIRHSSFGFLTGEEEEDPDFPTHALLTARSPQSNQSSLVHSHSGSVDMNEPLSNCINHGRTVSLEFSEMRASSASSDEGTTEMHGRTQSLELHNQQPTSPRPERKLTFMKHNSGSSSPNTLSVSYPYTTDPHPCDVASSELSPTSLLVPSPKTLSPTSRSTTHPPISPRLLKRGFPVSQSGKPPLIKTKNISPVGSSTQLQSHDNLISLELEAPSIVHASNNNPSMEPDEDSTKTKLNVKRNLRTDKRYHTADSIENMKRDRDPSIYKRLSLNYPSPNNCGGNNGHGSLQDTSSHNCKSQKQNLVDVCTSSESIYSSSGVSSTGSLHQVPNDADSVFALPVSASASTPMLERIKESGSRRNSSGPDMRLDVSEIKDGISSVQIRIQDSSTYGTQENIQKIKELILNDQLLEASEV